MRAEDSAADLDALLKRIRLRDEAAFAELLRRCTPQLSAYVRRQLAGGGLTWLDVSDVLQEVYLEAFQRLDQFSAVDGSSIHRWLYTIARHKIIDLARRDRAAKRGGGAERVAAEYVGPDGDVIPLLQELAVHERTPSLSAMAREQYLGVQAALERLRPLYREVIQMRYVHATPVEEIGRVLDRGPGAVHMLCNRALKELRRELNGTDRTSTG